MYKAPIWDFLKVDRLEYLAMSKDQKIAATKRYVHAMKNLDPGLNGEFIISSRKLSFLLIFASASSYSVVSFEILITVSVLQFLRQAGVNYILFRLV